jgi:catalase
VLDPEVAIDRLSAVYRRPEGVRALHSKGRLYAGTFTASSEAAELCRAPQFAGEPVAALVRWSNAAGRLRSDKAPDVRGMAVKLTGGRGGAEGAGDVDLLGQTAPRFPVRTPEAFVSMTEAIHDPKRMPIWLARNPTAIPALVANGVAKAAGTPRSFAEVTYFPVHAYGWRDATDHLRWVRYRLDPVPRPGERAAAAGSGRDALFDEMAARLSRGSVAYDLRVTLARATDDPHDPMSVWRGARELSAGILTVTAEAENPEDDGGLVVFDPTRVVDGIELSDDPILRYRPSAYSVSIERRHGT